MHNPRQTVIITGSFILYLSGFVGFMLILVSVGSGAIYKKQLDKWGAVQ